MAVHVAHATVVHGRYDIRILFKECASLAREPGLRVSLFVADGLAAERCDEVEICGVPRPGFGRAGRAILGSLSIWRLLRRTRPDLVHVHDPELLFLALALRATNTPVVFDMHENLPKEILTKPWVAAPLRSVASRTARAIQRAVCRRIPTVFAESSYAADFPSAKAGVVVLNYPLVRTLLGIARAKRSVFTVGYIGGITRDRGAVVIAEALAQLRGAGMPVSAVLVGNIAADLASAEPFTTAVAGGFLTCTGRLRPADGWPLMAECHVGVALLDASPNFVDSYPTKLFEYMALGLPVVVSDFPLWRAIVDEGRCGLLVDPTDAQAIAGALRWIAEHPGEARAMGERGRAAVVERYNWDSEFAKLATLYAELLPANDSGFPSSSGAR